MKKYIIIFIFLLSIAHVLAEDNIYSFLDNVVEDDDYVVVIGDSAPSIDVLAATDIAAGIQNYRKWKSLLEVKLVSEVTNNNKMILVGRPCNNPLIDLSCNDWPYEGSALFLKIDGSNLIVSGTTDNDVRSASKIIAQYQVFPYLKDSDILLISDAGIETPEVVPPPRGEEDEEQTPVEESPEEDSLEGPEVRPGLEGEVPAGEESYPKGEKLPEGSIFESEEEEKSFTEKILDWISGLFERLFG